MNTLMRDSTWRSRIREPSLRLHGLRQQARLRKFRSRVGNLIGNTEPAPQTELDAEAKRSRDRTFWHLIRFHSRIVPADHSLAPPSTDTAGRKSGSRPERSIPAERTGRDSGSSHTEDYPDPAVGREIVADADPRFEDADESGNFARIADQRDAKPASAN